ncbi:hypothetical protein ES332_A12G149700v1 [Gossypium tomentosum]|uniref:Pectinesterase inhibitor domain-containing protein n=1 Tax=Gossypium tomentosum TaxID=34277 RepID=A0A5D2MWT2_GOSTO|nr:hypothetical protein ES332_A12G149700v1 [Gossypium tomentosum]
MYDPSGRSNKIILVLLLVLVLISLIVPLEKSPETSETHHFHVNNNLQIAYTACEGTLYPDLCVATVSILPNLASRSLPDLISAILNQTMDEVRLSCANCTEIEKGLKSNTTLEWAAINDCIELFKHTLAELRVALAELNPKRVRFSRNYHKIKTFLSAAMTNQYTCLDGFHGSKGKTKYVIKEALHNISHHISNSLAMLNKFPGVNESKPVEVFPEYGRRRRYFPAWLSLKDRKLLQAPVDATEFDLIVAQDGSGNFTTIGDAVAAAPIHSYERFVIYIKAGAYLENIEVEMEKTMVMFVGDGIGKTVVKANRNVADGHTTFRSATVAVMGDGFIAKGITFENSAGPSKNQAVALRSGSDLSAFYKCSFVAYQDTLYVHSLRQFYRECDIYGTVDCIFGNAAAVFQACSLYARKPKRDQENVFTAQGRADPNQNTGISILNCKIRAGSDLIPVISSFKTYLGRPWKEYSRTVIMRSYIDDLVDTAGWLEWSGNFALNTLYYGEFLNRGPGSDTSRRVTWPGYRVITSFADANQFTVGAFIQGNQWLNSTDIPFNLGLR